MGTKVVIGSSITTLLALSSAVVVGFVLGTFAARRGKRKQGKQEQGQRRLENRGTKRKARIRKTADNARSKSAGLKSSSLLSGEKSHNEQLSRRTRKRNKKLAPKDLALDAFTRVAKCHVACIGEGDYKSILLLPRTVFIVAGRFLAHAECRDRLVTLGEAREAMAGVDQLRVLYVSCSWANAGYSRGDWAAKDFETTRAFLQRNPDLGYVYIGRSCVANGTDGPARAAQLRHVPLVLLRTDIVLVLPRPAKDPNGKKDSSHGNQHRHSDFRFYSGVAWSRMELALAAVGQAKVYVAFRAEPFSESMHELRPGKTNVGEMTRQAADALRVAVTAGKAMAIAPAGDDDQTGTGTERDDTEKSAAAVTAAYENWLGSDLNPLAALEEARRVVAAAEKLSDIKILESIQGMLPTSTPELTESLRASLGKERVDGARELALSVLLFTVLCLKPKESATYTDDFIEDVRKMEISYRPIAVVRSPYRERFGTPRQPQVTASVLHGSAQEAEIVFLKGHGYEEALEDLSGFEMIWVISHMHLNKGWNRKVRPPRLPEERKGLFSTRSPHRPNPLALSSLRVARVDAAKGVIYVHGLDLLDGTPVLDVKPYIGYCDAFPNMKTGWLDALGSDHEAQRDFLPKFSVGATLVHTVARSTVTEDFSTTEPVSAKPVEETSEGAS